MLCEPKVEQQNGCGNNNGVSLLVPPGRTITLNEYGPTVWVNNHQFDNKELWFMVIAIVALSCKSGQICSDRSSENLFAQLFGGF